MSKSWYAKKRDEIYVAYSTALESGDMSEAERLFKEYETYKELSSN